MRGQRSRGREESIARHASGLPVARLRLSSSIEALCCAALALLLLWKGILPAWRALNTDFPNYYLVARLLREGYNLDRIYDWIWLQRIKDHWGLDQTLVGFAGLTPFSALPIVPLAAYSALAAKRIWTVLNLLFLVVSVELLGRSTSLGRRRVWTLALLAVLPLRTSFLFGQMHLLVLLFLVLAYWFHSRKRDAACGICIALAGALKIYPLFFGLYFIWKKQWRAALSTAGAALAIVLASWRWMGGSVLHIYATRILPRSLQGEVLDPYNVHFGSTAALLHRLFLYEPTFNPSPLLYSPSMYAAVYPLWQLAVFFPMLAVFRPGPTEPEREGLEWATFLFSLLLLSPVPSSYHFVAMILPVVLLVDVLLRRGRYKLAGAAVALYTLISTVELWPLPQHLNFAALTLLGFARLWAEIALFSLFLVCQIQVWLIQHRAPQTFPVVHGRRVLLLCGGSALGLIASIAGYHRHFAHIKQDMARVILPPASSFLAAGPQPWQGGILFTAMVQGGYRIVDQPIGQSSGLIDRDAKAHDAPDQLSFAVTPDHSVLLELSDAAGSRIARVTRDDLASERQGVLHAGTLVQDAESPAISADGRWLAFIRERKGRGAIWIAHYDGVTAAPPVQAIDDSFNVYTVAFLPSGDLIFNAGRDGTDGRPGLFVATRGQPPRLLSATREEIGAFALSPNRQLIAFTKLEHNRRQLGYLNPATAHETMLTFGDCNAYDPSWIGPRTIVYASDCGRGLGLSALASVTLSDATAQSAAP
jgi:hypothetical protein